MNALMELIGAVRTLRVGVQRAGGLADPDPADERSAALADALAARSARCAHLPASRPSTATAPPPALGAHAVLRSGADLFLPLDRYHRRGAGAHPPEQSEHERIEAAPGTEARLGSEQFTPRAPAEIVAREREKADSLRDQRDRLAAKLKGLG
jgi:valyl-tRNA synthetase